jgi:hypothetical protein
MKKILYILLILLFFLPDLGARRRYGLMSSRSETSGSLVASLGPSFCIGDPTASIFKETFKAGLHNYDFSLGFRHWFPNNLGYKATFTYANYAGSDNPESFHSGVPYSFVSNYYEASVRAEYAIMIGSRWGRIAPSAVYGFIGGAYMNSSVKFPQYIMDDTSKINSNQGTPSNTGFVIPFGVGYQYKYDKKISIGAEFMLKYAFTDFVDGYHAKTSDFNDLIFGLSFTLGYTIF